MKQVLPRAWYSSARWVRVLYPLSVLYEFIARRNRAAYESGRKPVHRAGVPVIVIGNITAGGTGKTPLTLALAKFLQEQGRRPAIITRGYKGRSSQYPLLVTSGTSAADCGDEPKLLAMNTNVPVVVDPDRSRGVRFLESRFQPDVLLCDDGLQHHALARDIEIAVIDGERGFGNGLLLPAGPLREKVTRLDQVDFVIVNGLQSRAEWKLPQAKTFAMTLNPDCLVNPANKISIEFSAARLRALGHVAADSVHAIAGIGNPQRFFSLLRAAGFVIMPHAYPDHHRFSKTDIEFSDRKPVIMTEKDAVKCLDFATDVHWYLKVSAQLQNGFWQALMTRLEAADHQLHRKNSASFS